MKGHSEIRSTNSQKKADRLSEIFQALRRLDLPDGAMTEKKVRGRSKKIDGSTAAGPDGIGSAMTKRLPQVVMEPFIQIFGA